MTLFLHKNAARIFVLTALIAIISGVPHKAHALSELLGALSPSSFLSAQDAHITLANTGNQEKMRHFIEKMGEEAVDFLGDESLSTSEKERKFNKLLNEKFDMETIGRFSLGHRWRELTPEQRREYQGLFKEMIVKIYAQRFSDYQGQTFDVVSARAINEDDALVRSYIIPDTGNKILVEWRVRKNNGGMKIIDVIIEEVSMTMTQRSDFNSIIQRGGGSAAIIIDHLRERLKNSGTAAPDKSAAKL